MACPVCHISVAPFDPEKVERNGTVYHRKCANKVKPTEQTQQQRKPKQMFFRFPQQVATVQ